jgi:glucans biosynthesis protein
MDRRAFLMIAGLGAVAAMAGRADAAVTGEAEAPATPFSWEGLKEQAKALASKPFDPGLYTAPPGPELDYDGYRFIHFNPKKAIWREEPLNFQLQLFHGGYIYKEPVAISIVEDGQARTIPYRRSFYEFGPAEKRVNVPDEGFYSGFRVHAPIYSRDDYSEFLLFQGASYFRSKAKGQTYGLSARCFAINTGLDSVTEEFPAFRALWVEKPKPGENRIVVYALIDSKSVSGAYRFVTVPDGDSVMDIECQIFPRAVLNHAGIAPFSSMFFFGPGDQTKWDDFRPHVHDSDGLSMLTSTGDWIWRPLVTARHILYSVFFDNGPKGFGLIQRERDFDKYQDIGAAYQDRPSAWVEPLSDWGEGSLDLIELPTDSEYADNIVAFWRPKEPFQPLPEGYNYRYRLSWLYQTPLPASLARITQTRAGQGLAPNSRFILVDFAGGDIFAKADEEQWDYDVHASAGYIKAFSLVPHPFIDGKRVGIEYYPDGNKVADLSFQIRRMGTPISEKWVYRWAP